MLYALLSGVFLSTGGLVARFLHDVDPWAVLLVRSLAFFLTVLAFLFFRYRRELPGKFLALQPLDGLVTVCLALGFIFYLLSLYHTSVANTVLLLSTGPLFAAALAWLCLREPVAGSTWIAMLLAIVGVVIMVSGGLSLGDERGMLYAVIAVFVYAVMLVTMRRQSGHRGGNEGSGGGGSEGSSGGGSRDLLPATALAGLLAAVLVAPMVDSVSMSGMNFFWCLVFGSVQIGSGFILVTLAARTVPAAQVALLGLSETALAPLWVWIVINEIPATNTMLGGVVILLAVAGNGVQTLRQEQRLVRG